MTQMELLEIKRSFDGYVNQYAVTGGKLHPWLQLKLEHSVRVAAETRELSCNIGLPLAWQNTAEALGLLHDIGRFPQFNEFGTFSDSFAVDHGECGWSVARQANWLERVQVAERNAILSGIRYHNRVAIPENLAKQELAMLRLVRDADKLDIFKVVLDAIARDGFNDLAKMLPNIILDRSPSPGLFYEISQCENTRRGNIPLSKVTTLADFLLMQAVWVYDLNYRPTFQRFLDRGILERIFKQLESNSEIIALKETLRSYVHERLVRCAGPTVDYPGKGQVVKNDFDQPARQMLPCGCR